MVVASLAQEVGRDSPPPVPSAGESGTDAVDGSEIADGVTPLRSWAPPDATRLIDAVACHRSLGDWYVIVASFDRGASLDDQVWLVVVDGLSTWPTYGEAVGTLLLDTFREIRSVDCSTDGTNVYAAWDRFQDVGSGYWHYGRWKRATIDGYGNPTASAAYSIGTTCGFNVQGESDYAGTPRIAWEPGGRVGVIYATRRPNGDATGCIMCVEVFEAASGSLVATNHLWHDLSQYNSFDIEWNTGYYKFLVVDLMGEIGGSMYWETNILSRDAVWGAWHSLDPASHSVQNVDLVFSNNSRNQFNRLVAFTRDEVYWIRGDGARIGEYGWAGPSYFAGCEYWGSSLRIGHSYALWTAPYSYHHHWGASYGAPLESYYVGVMYPVACASSDTFNDPEVLYVSRQNVGSHQVSWNIEPEE